MLRITGLIAAIGGTTILNNISVEFQPGTVHVVMGANGSGKSTFAATVMGAPHISVVSGSIELDGQDITHVPPEERARRGVYLGFQYPPEIAGVSLPSMVRTALVSRGEHAPAQKEFRPVLEKWTADLGLDMRLLECGINEGFSGGEKKRNEILQVLLLRPRVAILDEFDSGLDVDGVRACATALNNFHTTDRTLIVITHYGKIVEHLQPDAVHVFAAGRVAASGGQELVKAIEEKGYEQFQ